MKEIEHIALDGELRIARHVPNAISALRIVLSLSLLNLKPLTGPFFAVYIMCGVTDALDGFIARKLHVESTFGAKIDSIADLVFFGSALYVFVSSMSIPLFLLVWAAVLVFYRALELFLAFRKYKAWPALHTRALKVSGLFFFLFPFGYFVLGSTLAGIVMLGIATVAVIEESFINKHASVLNVNITSASSLRQIDAGGHSGLQ